MNSGTRELATRSCTCRTDACPPEPLGAGTPDMGWEDADPALGLNSEGGRQARCLASGPYPSLT